MKDNIESAKILNRKIILELRFEHKVLLMDKKGQLIDEIVKSNIFPNIHWEAGDANLLISDNPDKNQKRNHILIELTRLSYFCSKVDSIEKFNSTFILLYETVKNVLGELNISRVGCRIIGTYKSKSNDFDSILKSFKSAFPTTFYLDGFPARDMRFNLVYQNGMYQIGPINKKDKYTEQEFPYTDRIDSEGVAIDTDNYLLRVNENKGIDLKLIKDVFTASLAVEKALYENLKEF